MRTKSAAPKATTKRDRASRPRRTKFASDRAVREAAREFIRENIDLIRDLAK